MSLFYDEYRIFIIEKLWCEMKFSKILKKYFFEAPLFQTLNAPSPRLPLIPPKPWPPLALAANPKSSPSSSSLTSCVQFRIACIGGPLSWWKLWIFACGPAVVVVVVVWFEIWSRCTFVCLICCCVFFLFVGAAPRAVCYTFRCLLVGLKWNTICWLCFRESLLELASWLCTKCSGLESVEIRGKLNRFWLLELTEFDRIDRTVLTSYWKVLASASKYFMLEVRNRGLVFFSTETSNRVA